MRFLLYGFKDKLSLTLMFVLLTICLSGIACGRSDEEFVEWREDVEESYTAKSSDVTDETTTVMNVYGEKMELSFELWDPGTETVIDYEKYGEFTGLGTGKFRYQITDRKGLSQAAGEGVYPSTSVYRDPAYRKLQQTGKLKGIHWDFTNIDNYQLSFYKWATAPEAPGVKQFFTALALERAGFISQALKAYHAVPLYFAKQPGWTVFQTPIYYAQRAMDKIEFLTREHPELGIQYVDFDFQVANGDNLTISDDEYLVIHPGRFLPGDPRKAQKTVDVNRLKVQREVGGDHVKLVQYNNGHWQLKVDGKPFMAKAIAYEPTPVGQSTHDGTRVDWMQADLNKNGKIDGPYDTWVDKNNNSQQDADEPVVGDFQLLKEMGANVLRHYHGASNKELMREAYENYGLMSMVGDLMGMYAGGSGAEWYEGTDFTNPEHLKNMRESIREMVLEHKDESYVLMWVLSNEGNYGFVGDPEASTLGKRLGLGSNGKEQHTEMYKFANEMAAMIKSLDPDHPVAFSNGELIFIEEIGQIMPNVDIFGVNAYRGKDGFGYSFWHDVKRYVDKPILITEFGCPAFHNRKSEKEAEALQTEYLKGNWEDILYNRAGSGAGNAIGGVAFQFVDEWWKAGPAPEFDPYVQETVGDFQANFPDGWMHEEWLGVTSHGDGSQSPYLRHLRESYSYFKDAWNQEIW